MKKVQVAILSLSLLGFSYNVNAQGKWSNLDGGIPLNLFGVVALCADTVNNVLYAGGEFTSAGSVQQNALAKWDGTNWDTTTNIDSGKWVYALIMYKGNLIVGFADGSVGEYNGSTLNYLPGFSAAVYCFYIYNDTLYAGGDFYKSGNTILNCIGKWNGTKWLPVDKGVSWIYGADVVAMTEYNGDLIAAGIFDSAGSIEVSSSSIASYDGSKWNSLNVNLSDFGSPPYNAALEVYKNKLYVIGTFDSVNSVYCIGGAASWDGTNWDTLFSTYNPVILSPPAHISMATFDSYLFVAGRYDNEVPYKYDGNVVSTVDSGVGGNIYAMTVWRGSLYVGGDFQATLGAKPYTPCVARWTPDTTTTVIKQPVKDNELVSVYPNPFSEETTLQFSQPVKSNSQLTISDLTGRVVENYTLQNGTTKFTIQKNNLSPAMYFYRLTCQGRQEYVGKIVLVK